MMGEPREASPECKDCQFAATAETTGHKDCTPICRKLSRPNPMPLGADITERERCARLAERSRCPACGYEQKKLAKMIREGMVLKSREG